LASASSVAPADFDEMARRYTSDIRSAVRRAIPWANPEDREETVQYILGQFVANDVITQFRPELASERASDPFRAFILAKAALYCRGKAQALASRYGREVYAADVQVGDGSSSWIEQVADGGPDGYAFVEDEVALEELRARLAARPPEPGQPGLLELFDELRGRVEAGQTVSVTAVRRRFGMRPGQAAGYLGMLRDEIRAAAAGEPPAPLVDLGVAQLPPDVVLAAAAALEASAGNQVVKVWQRAGHPLAAYGRTWYLEPAKAELARFAYLRGAKGGHYEGGHGSPVKRGLVHWLRRMATGEVPPPPRRPAVVQDEHFEALEAALWQIPGSDAHKVDEVLMLARRVFG